MAVDSIPVHAAAGCDGEIMARRNVWWSRSITAQPVRASVPSGPMNAMPMPATAYWISLPPCNGSAPTFMLGGDAGNVTIFGQSAAAPGGRADGHGRGERVVPGLWCRAPFAIRMAAPEEAALHHALMRELGMAGGDRSVDAGGETPAAQAAVQWQATTSVRLSMDAAWSHPFDPFAPAVSADVPLLIGTCETELTFSWA
jgi:hypothetical protein